MSGARELQREVNNTLSNDEVDWDIVRMRAGMPGVNLKWVDPRNGLSVLHRAATDGAIDILQRALAEDGGTPVDAVTHMGRTALHMASDAGQVRAVKILLEAHADINKKTLGRSTALHMACRAGHAHVVEALFKSGQMIDVHEEDDRRQTAEQLAKSPVVKRQFRLYEAEKQKVLENEALRAASKGIFEVFDQDGDGWISPAEFAEVHSVMVSLFSTVEPTEAERETLFREADLNRDGTISLKEFQDSQQSLLSVLNISVQTVCDNLDQIKGALKSGPPCTLADLFSAPPGCKDEFKAFLRQTKLPADLSQRIYEDNDLKTKIQKCYVAPGPRKAFLVKGPACVDGTRIRTGYNDQWPVEFLEAVAISVK
mmetsp:Transcript_40295/g.96627  ORF Transcript_40295/g.96627 Transcript_40295/m.96627 type:complete len:370 (-) Transcript_40295:281-1390(-)